MPLNSLSASLCLDLMSFTQRLCVSTTFSALHSFNKDSSTVGQHPVPAAVTVLPVHHGAKRMGYLKELSPGLMMLLP